MPEMSAGQAAVVSILLWWATNIFTVIANKWIFQILQFAYPLTLTGVRTSPRTHAPGHAHGEELTVTVVLPCAGAHAGV
jgi:hypothetical protein